MSNLHDAAALIHQCWNDGEVTDYDCAEIWPKSVDDGYAVQALLAELREEPIIGWKIAATAIAGRTHINVDQPLAGRLYPSICHKDGATIPIKYNRMAVAEVEFVFTLGKDLPPRDADYSLNEVAEAIELLHPGLEIPDSRFADFTKPGTAGLVADNACAANFILGKPSSVPFNAHELAAHPTQLLINDQVATTGYGSDALGGPLLALQWLTNQLNRLELGLDAGQFITTGVTGKPTTIKPGDIICADLGQYGSVTAQVS